MSYFIKSFILALLLSLAAIHSALAVTIDINHDLREYVILKAGDPLIVNLPLDTNTRSNAEWIVHEPNSLKGLAYKKSEVIGRTQRITFMPVADGKGLVMIGLTRAPWYQSKVQRVFKFMYQVSGAAE